MRQRMYPQVHLTVSVQAYIQVSERIEAVAVTAMLRDQDVLLKCAHSISTYATGSTPLPGSRAIASAGSVKTATLPGTRQR